MKRQISALTGIKRCMRMCIEVISNKNDLFCVGIQNIRYITKDMCEIQCGPSLRYNRFPLSSQRLRDHKNICDTVAHIYGIDLFGLSRFTRDAVFPPISCLFISSTQTTGRSGSYGRWQTSNTASIFDTNSASAAGIHHSFTSQGLISFFLSRHKRYCP